MLGDVYVLPTTWTPNNTRLLISRPGKAPLSLCRFFFGALFLLHSFSSSGSKKNPTHTKQKKKKNACDVLFDAVV